MAYPENRVEHRWGERVRVSIPVHVTTPALAALDGRMENLSLSGALMKADYDLRLARHEKAGIIERDVEPLAALQLGIPFPKYVSRSELLQRLKQEILSLSDDDLAWWEGHKAKPFPVIHGDKSHFVVAVAGHDVLFFADDEDEFGVARLVAGSHTMTDYGLVGDLKDAIWEIRQNRLLN